MTNKHVSCVGIQSRDGAWDPPHKWTLGEWTGRRHLAGSGILDQWRVTCRRVACRHSVSWRRVRPSAQIDFRRMNGVTCDWSIDGSQARPGTIKGSLQLSGAHSTIRRRKRQHVSLNFWKEGEEGEGGGGRWGGSAKKTKEHRRRLRIIKED